MQLLLLSFVAGILSVLAPCVISILPIILSRSMDDSAQEKRNPYLIIFSLLSSIFVFTLILKASTLLIDIPTSYWQVVSGSIILLFGLISLFPSVWEKVSSSLRLQQRTQKHSSNALKKHGVLADISLGASLGPVFSACSPTYALIIAGVLPVSLLRGLLYLIVFLLGLGAVLVLISMLGQQFIKKIGWSINPHGWFKRLLAVIFILIGLSILTGYDKKISSYFVERGLFDWQVNLESKYLQ